MMVGCVIAPDTIHIWNAQTGNAIGEPVKVPASRITSIGFSLDGTKLVSESIDNVTHSIRIWDIERAVPVRELHRPMESVRSFFCSPDCTRVIVTHEQGGGIEIWNVVEGSMVGNVQGGACWIKSVEISPDGSRMVVVPSEGEIQLWDVPGRSLVKIFPSTPIFLHHLQSTSWAIFSQDGSRIAYEYSGREAAQVYIIDAATGAAIGDPFFSYIRQANSILSSDCSRMLYVPYDMRAFAVWDFKCGDRSAQDTYRFPPYLMMNHLNHVEDGWLRGETGGKLLWVPSDEKGVWCIMPGRVILGHETGKLVIVDVEDYSKLPPVHYGWRGQVRYVNDPRDVQLAGVLRDLLN